MTTGTVLPLGLFVLKVASRCNLNCDYCYVYNKVDDTWRVKPKMMPEDVFSLSVQAIKRHCALSGQTAVEIAFHGGEPMLLGSAKFDRWCGLIRAELGDLVSTIRLQTNATQIDDNWVRVLCHHDIQVGVSMDGPKPLHDKHRVDHRGRGSYDAVRTGIEKLAAGGIPFQILSVIPLGEDPLLVHNHFLELRPKAINYLPPDCTRDTVLEVKRRFGPTPCSDFLIPIFDHWFAAGPDSVRVLDFWNISRLLLGGHSIIENFGNRPSRYVFIEADGDIEGLDVLRICGNGMSKTGLNVRKDDFSELADVTGIAAQIIQEGLPLPAGCRSCVERTTCSGGYVPHRYSSTNGFNNPSAWCDDILSLISHIRSRLRVSYAETAHLQSKRNQAVSGALRSN